MDYEYGDWLPSVMALTKEAGRGILEYCGDSVTRARGLSYKPDDTMLTEADLCAHNIIFSGLQELSPTIPVLSEEGNIDPYTFRKSWEWYWLIDPLDGTRGFVEKGTEFTVNIALIHHHRPVLGVVYVPVGDVAYCALHKHGAFREAAGERTELHTAPLDWDALHVLLGSYVPDHTLPDALAALPGSKLSRLNSSIKFGWIAEGRADMYLRQGGTSEWDTAAAQCVLEEAGGAVLDWTGKPLRYNTQDSVSNPPFVAVGDLSQAEAVLAFIQKHQGES